VKAQARIAGERDEDFRNRYTALIKAIPKMKP